MSDTPDDQQLSKRQRQKQRRQEKLEAQKAATAAARRKRMIATVTIVALVVGVTGFFAYGWVSDRFEERQLIAAAGENLDALGCTEIVEEPILPSTHFSEAELAANPPEAVYDTRPATSGRHLGSVVATGVYDKVVDERVLIHNLEHGYVNFYYADDAPEDQVEALKAFARDQIDSRRHEKIIVSKWKAGLEGDRNFAMAAWGARQVCRDFDEGVALNFLREYHYLAGSAPERDIRPHIDEGIDPDATDGDFLLPPLADAEAPEGDVMDDDGDDPDADEAPDQ